MTEPKAMLVDVTRCTGCEACVEACKAENDLGADRPSPGRDARGDLSATRFTTVLPRPDGRYVRNLCRHCVEPACVSACIVGALEKTPEGPVVYDADRCMGCRYCMLACPYGVPRYDWDAPVHFIRKCTFCAPRLARGLAPACVDACPEGVMTFGPRAAVLAAAHRRLAEAPGRYLPRVFGEEEVGGTSVLYLSDVPLDFLGWKPGLGPEPLPALTEAVMSKVPGVALGTAALMTGLWWVLGRRDRLREEAAAGRTPAPEGGEDGAA